MYGHDDGESDTNKRKKHGYLNITEKIRLIHFVNW